VVDVLADTGHDGEEADNLFGAIDALRIPVEYLAELFTAGDVGPVRAALQRLAAMRAHMRRVNLAEQLRPEIAQAVRLTPTEIEAMYRLLAIAKYDERYVIPSAAGSDAHRLDALATGCSLDSAGGPGMTAFDVMDDKFHLTQRLTGDDGPVDSTAAPADKGNRINLLNWDGKRTNGLFPPTENGNGVVKDQEQAEEPVR
ncbi:MAG: nitrate reductase subunit beta, partial [Pseudonocardiaceae bacterium]